VLHKRLAMPSYTGQRQDTPGSLWSQSNSDNESERNDMEPNESKRNEMKRKCTTTICIRITRKHTKAKRKEKRKK